MRRSSSASRASSAPDDPDRPPPFAPPQETHEVSVDTAPGPHRGAAPEPQRVGGEQLRLLERAGAVGCLRVRRPGGFGLSRRLSVPLQQLLSTSFARQRACLINPNHALTSPVAPGDPFGGTTTCTPTPPTAAKASQEGTNTNHFVVADRMGDVVSYTNTIEQLGGSGIVVPGRGFLLNNELTDFQLRPDAGRRTSTRTSRPRASARGRAWRRRSR